MQQACATTQGNYEVPHLADHHRRKILSRLAELDMTIIELAQRSGVHLSGLSKFLNDNGSSGSNNPSCHWLDRVYDGFKGRRVKR